MRSKNMREYESKLVKSDKPFYTTKQRNEGTGLGLSISYGIAKDHGGDISFETKQGEYRDCFKVRVYLQNGVK